MEGTAELVAITHCYFNLILFFLFLVQVVPVLIYQDNDFRCPWNHTVCAIVVFVYTFSLPLLCQVYVALSLSDVC